ncbi:hydroxymethylglutaryl-CoA lyase [Gammaproteobacteria bacterium]|nr:hydroxymethylglutaryl-CoA lyase [Gammaproteobacteria bacterium]MDB9700770.1 hydroxymethylglutaryl-CoA lyase [Gammaproteobacteria bacterium]MDC0091410.1 hydroxymethylglutaryl-CoA lyase [Gammaproteobacteria bacterium]
MNSEFVYINEVGPRDGLQNQKTILDTEDRLKLISLLIDANIPGIEVASFVNPKAVPAMAGAHEIIDGLQEALTCDISVLVPNMKGFELAQAAGAKIIAVVPSATETMNQKNINMSLKDTLDSSCKILESAKSEQLQTRAYVSVAWECPYEGVVEIATVLDIAHKLLSAGADEIILADTIGAANPASVDLLFQACVKEFNPSILSGHFHDTRAMALANVYAALTQGIRKFDSCIGGLGGCPFAPGAAGNLATEDLANMLNQMGFETQVDLPKLLEIVDFCSDKLGAPLGGRMSGWLTK